MGEDVQIEKEGRKGTEDRVRSAVSRPRPRE